MIDSAAPMDAQSCLKQGAVGVLGAIPGTVLAHPFDVLKIRMQTGTASTLVAAAQGVVRGTGPLGFYWGLTAGVQQKVLTRGPMFLASEASTQLCELQLGMQRTPAVFLGSVCSGYLTGSLAAMAEWQKVLGATAKQQPGPSAGSGSAHGSLFRQAAAAGQLRSVWRRLHGAGTRNAIFDGTFFGTSHVLGLQPGLADSPGFCYAAAASAAVVVDYCVDVAVKRSMVLGPATPVPDAVWRAAWELVRTKGRSCFVGLSAKTLEFATSYFVTGVISVPVLAALVTSNTGE